MRRTMLDPRLNKEWPAPTRSGARKATAQKAWLAIPLLALVLAVLGTGLAARRHATAAVTAGDTASQGGLTARLREAGWLAMNSHQSDSSGGYQMPAQMMPGAPAGDEMRLGVSLTLVNTSEQTQRFNLAEEFRLAGGPNPEPRALHSDTFGRLPRLAPKGGVDGVLYFDTTVPAEDDPPLYLLWRRESHTVRMLVAVGQHAHGS